MKYKEAHKRFYNSSSVAISTGNVRCGTFALKTALA